MAITNGSTQVKFVFIGASSSLPSGSNIADGTWYIKGSNLYLGNGGNLEHIGAHVSSGATVPSSGMAVGDFFYDTANSKLKYYNGTAWVEVGSGSGGVTSVNGNTGAVTVNELPAGTASDVGSMLVYGSTAPQWQVREYVETITGTGSKTEFEIEHFLDHEGCSVEVVKMVDDRLIPCQVYMEHNDEDTVTLYFAIAPTTQDRFKVIVRR